MAKKYFQCATILSLTMRVYLHSFSRCCLPNMSHANWCIIPRKFELTAVQGHPRAMILVPIENACDFPIGH